MEEKYLSYLKSYREKYTSDLLSNILPFWMKYGLDWVNGGIFTCLDRFGKLMDSTKSVWFQGRAAYIFASAYNNVAQNPEFLKASRCCIDFIEKHCFDKDGRMWFEVTAEGVPLRKRRYVFSECFAAIAMAEYSLASGNAEYADKALTLFKKILLFINSPGLLTPKYLPTQPAIGHSITMILINTAAVIRKVKPDLALSKQIDDSLDLISSKFMHPEFEALLEMVTPEGNLIDTLNGRVINPGHCIETAWFILEEAKFRGWDSDDSKRLKQMALTILDWSWKWGWDEEFGGIINFRDCKGFPPQDYSQDMKFWWPQTETVIASLYAYQATGDPRYLQMYMKVNDWMYAHFPDNEFLEWFGYLHRDGSVAQTAKGNLFKGPFHIPRMMIKSRMLIDDIL